jgi:small subunit ribosomal protein S19
MGRSIGKGPYIAYHLLNKLEKLNSKGSKEIIKTPQIVLPIPPIPPAIEVPPTTTEAMAGNK